MTAPSPLVIDASVAIKWYVSEQDSAKALSLLALGALGQPLIAPDLLVAELGNILWKKVRRGEISSADGGEALKLFLTGAPVTLHSSSQVAEDALRIALATGNTVYDCLYVALAVAEQGTLCTADQRLVDSLQGNALGASVVALAAM
jgi:predicted nucleic acid-binding protein